jgi:hypothetical protein
MPKIEAAPTHSSSFSAENRPLSSIAVLQLETELIELQALSLNNVSR